MESYTYPSERNYYKNKIPYEPNVDYLYRPGYQPNLDYVYKPVEQPGIDYLYKPNDQSHYGFLYEPIPDYMVPDRLGRYPDHSNDHCCSHRKCHDSQPDYLTMERKAVADENVDMGKRYPFLIDRSHVETITDKKYQKINRRLGYNPVEFSTIYVEKCTSIDAVMDAHRRDPNCQICVLNYANSITPGGEFRKGKATPEASLCRHTLLYSFLEGNPMYTANRKASNEMEGSDTMIYTPNVPVIRDSMYKEIVHPFKINVISATPVDNRKYEVVAGPKIMERRIKKIVKLAASKNPDVLILGPIGCGELKNDPKKISKFFYNVLINEGMKSFFPQIVFAVGDDPLIFDIFRNRFNEH